MASSTQTDAVNMVAASIRQFENSIDQTMIEGAAFIATMLRARQDARLAASAGHQALGEAVSALNHAHQARQALIRCHDQLDDLRRQLKLPEVADGGKAPPPSIASIASPAKIDT